MTPLPKAKGEVEQISSMKPMVQSSCDEGFLEYLEDIIGSNQYVERLEAPSKQLEELNEKIDSMVQRGKVAEKEEDGKNEAEQFMLKEGEFFTVEETCHGAYSRGSRCRS